MLTGRPGVGMSVEVGESRELAVCMLVWFVMMVAVSEEPRPLSEANKTGRRGEGCAAV